MIRCPFLILDNCLVHRLVNTKLLCAVNVGNQYMDIVVLILERGEARSGCGQ